MTADPTPGTWAAKVAALACALGRKPTLDDLIAEARGHEMTPAERETQRESWVRAMTTPCEHGVLDFEQCGDCRAALRAQESRDE